MTMQTYRERTVECLLSDRTKKGREFIRQMLFPKETSQSGTCAGSLYGRQDAPSLFSGPLLERYRVGADNREG